MTGTGGLPKTSSPFEVVGIRFRKVGSDRAIRLKAVSGSLGWLGRLPPLVGVRLAMGCAVAGSGGHAGEPSPAGAAHILPATWAIYGRGSIHRPKDAIPAAAHLLAAHGAAQDIAAALHAYNPSWRYVDAVLRYARSIRHDPHALAGYYHRQVICRLASGWVLLPVGYGINPSAQPIALHR